ncbi:2932_t:CDS:2, partial [Entrophospora sp. SA101]
QECHGIFNKRWKQFDTDIYILAFSYTQNIVFEIYKNTIKTALTLWKQFGGGATSADILRTQCHCTKIENHLFKKENFIDLNHELLTNNVDNDLTDEFVEHGDVNFDIDEILNRVES